MLSKHVFRCEAPTQLEIFLLDKSIPWIKAIYMDKYNYSSLETPAAVIWNLINDNTDEKFLNDVNNMSLSFSYL